MKTNINEEKKPVFDFEEYGTLSFAERVLRDAKVEYIDVLGECPSAGGGVHRWILKATTLAVCAQIDWVDAKEQIRHAMKDCGRGEQHNEIWAAYDGAVRYQNSCVITAKKKSPEWHPHDEEKAEALLSEFEEEAKKIGVHLHSIPEAFQSDAGNTRDILMGLSKGYGGAKAVLRTLYPDGDPLICCGESMRIFTTKKLSEYQSLMRYQLIVPNPMTKELGIKSSYQNTPEDELPKEAYSAHTKDNTGEKYYQVIEFDNADLNYQARACSYLRKFLPLAMVVFSGNKSLHQWYSVKDQDPEYVQDFFNLAHCMGADPAMWNPWQFARMPHVIRNDDKVRDVEQKVHFLASPEDQRTCPMTEGIEFPMPILRQQ